MNECSNKDCLSFSDSINCNFDYNDKYRKILKELPCPVILLDKDNNISEVNYKAYCIFKSIDLQNELEKSILRFLDKLSMGEGKEENVFKSEDRKSVV